MSNNQLAQALGVYYCQGCDTEIPNHALQEETQITADQRKDKRINLIDNNNALWHNGQNSSHSWLVFDCDDFGHHYHIALTIRDIK